MNTQLNDIVKASIDDLKELIDVDIVVGKAITLDGSIIIPISKIKCAYISGGMDMPTSASALASNMTITPIAFLVKEENNVKVLHLENNAHILEYILDSGVDVIKRIIDLIKESKQE